MRRVPLPYGFLELPFAIAANFVGVCFAAGRQQWELWTIQVIPASPCTSWLQGHPLLQWGPMLLPSFPLRAGVQRDPLPWFCHLGLGFGCCPAPRGSLHAAACRTSAPWAGGSILLVALRSQLTRWVPCTDKTPAFVFIPFIFFLVAWLREVLGLMSVNQNALGL